MSGNDKEALKPYLEKYLKLHGVEFEANGKFLCPFHEEKTPSMHIMPGSNGATAYCFGCDETADIFTFAAHFHNLDEKTDFGEIKRLICGELGFAGGACPPPPPPSKDGAGQKQAKKPPVALSVDAAKAVYNRQAVTELGKFIFGGDLKEGAEIALEKAWPCYNEAGEVEFVEVRFAPGCFKNGKKRPCAVWYDGRRVKSKGNPHGLFGRDLLARYPSDAPVLIVEGPKCQEAAKALLPSFIPVAWNGGAQGQKKVNFSPLRGRRVYIIPDDDEAGEKGARATAKMLKGIAAETIIVRPLPEARDIKPVKADIVEWLQVKSAEEVTEYILGHKDIYKAEEPAPPLPLHKLRETEKENYTELAGKYEYDGGLKKEDAEKKAFADVLEERKDKKNTGPRFVRIGGAAVTPIKWIVKNFLETGALGMIFGDSGTYKSFFSVALSSCIATGRDFFNMPVRRKGAVYYIAAEGQMGIIRRFRAWSQENQSIVEAPLYRYTGVINLSAAADVLIKALDEIIKTEPAPPVLAVIDTWSRSLGDDDSDTTVAAEGLGKLDTIRAQFPDIAVLIIHHTGHANKDRARGASLLHAAVDSEYRLELDKDRNIIVTNTKSKESELLPPMAFKARGVKLLDYSGGYILSEDNEIETSAVLDVVADYVPVESLGDNQKWVIDTLKRQEERRLEYSDLLQAFKTDTGKRKCQLDQSLENLELKGFIHRDFNFICFGGSKNA